MESAPRQTSHRGGPRGAVWDTLLPLLGRTDPEPLHVVDLGGGTGGVAVAIAELGHRVTVVDPSPNALATFAERAAQAGVTASVRGVIGDAATLADAVGPESVDVVVCHGVLEVLDDPAAALHVVAEVLRPGGRLSLLAIQRSGAVLAQVLGGHVDAAVELLRAGEDGPPWRFSRSRLAELVEAAGLAVVEVRGVRVLTDHVSGVVVDAQPGAAASLAELERDVAADPDFLPFAGQLHLVAERR